MKKLRRLEEDKEVNRNELGKSLHTPRERRREALLENVESNTPKQMAQLKRESPMMNRDLCPDGLINALQSDVVARTSMQPLVFERKHYTLDAARLFRQCARFRAREGEVPPPVLHNFKRDSAQYRQLFLWAPHDAVSRLLEPVLYQVHVVGEASQRARPNPRFILALADLQNALIHSYRGTVNVTPAQLIDQVEVALDAVLGQILVRGTRALFVFDWSEAADFRLVLCFEMRGRAKRDVDGGGAVGAGEEKSSTVGAGEEKEKRKKKGGADEMIAVLSRGDLFDDLVVPQQPEAKNKSTKKSKKGEKKGGEEGGCDMAQIRALLVDCVLSFRCHAFGRSDPG